MPIRGLLHPVLLWVGNVTGFVIYWGSFTKAAKMEILNVKMFFTGEAATSKSSHCRYSTK